MALRIPQLQRSVLNRGYCNFYECYKAASSKNPAIPVNGGGGGRGGWCCSAIAIDSPSSLASVSGIGWGSALVQGAREEMEDDLVLVQSSEDLGGFSYAAVFDGHAGASSVLFLRLVTIIYEWSRDLFFSSSSFDY